MPLDIAQGWPILSLSVTIRIISVTITIGILKTPIAIVVTDSYFEIENQVYPPNFGPWSWKQWIRITGSK